MLKITIEGAQASGKSYWAKKLMECVEEEQYYSASREILGNHTERITIIRTDDGIESIEQSISLFHRTKLIDVQTSKEELAGEVKTFLHEELMPLIKGAMNEKNS